MVSVKDWDISFSYSSDNRNITRAYISISREIYHISTFVAMLNSKLELEGYNVMIPTELVL